VMGSLTLFLGISGSWFQGSERSYVHKNPAAGDAGIA
jgi:hypothetical protein